MMKVKNRLLNFGDNIIYQDNDNFLMSMDSMLLANFVNIKYSDKKIIDLCSGNAPIPMLLTFRTKNLIYGVELQKNIFNMGLDSIKENKMDNQITFINDDINNLYDRFEAESFDIVTCNPPYFKLTNDGLINDDYCKSVARHEIKVNLEQIVSCSSYLLKNGGNLSIIHRSERLIEICETMKKYKLEPKRIRFVYSNFNKRSNLVLIEGIKNGRSGLIIEQPLIIYESVGKYSDEVYKMFGEG